jgi:lactate 2-monooxygenase
MGEGATGKGKGQAPRNWGRERQREIYLAGLSGSRPAAPIAIEDVERRAKEKMTPQAYDYVAGGAGAESTMRANRQAFERWRIVPKMFRNVAERDLSVELLGQRLAAPVLLGPVGVQSIIHPEAELASARAAAAIGIPFVLSTAASRSIEQVAEAMGAAPRWYQLYWGTDNEMAASMVARAERAGYSAIVLTLDTPALGWRERDLAHPYMPFFEGEGLANYFSDPVFRSRLAEPPEKNPRAAIEYWATVFSNLALTWSDLAFLRKHTRLPILLKGIVDTDDAREAVKAGADGIIVSNHGGRQIDGAQAALDSLPTVVAAVKGRMPVLFDSGVRRGADALKALALGARAVLLGRTYVWGLGAAGEAGVSEVVRNFLADFDLTMALSGFASVSEVDGKCLVRQAADED